MMCSIGVATLNPMVHLDHKLPKSHMTTIVSTVVPTRVEKKAARKILIRRACLVMCTRYRIIAT